MKKILLTGIRFYQRYLSPIKGGSTCKFYPTCSQYAKEAIEKYGALKGGRIATNTTTFNRELLIVEKENDGKPFELHTSYEDKENYYRNLRNPWLLILLMFAIFAVINHSIVFGVLALISLIPVLVYQIQIMHNRQEAKTQE